MLIAHEMVCEEEDRVDSYDSIEFYPIAERDYVDRFTEYDNFVLRDIDQENILDGLIRNDQSEQISEFRYLIFDSDRELDQEDYSGLRLAKKPKMTFVNGLESISRLDLLKEK